MSDEKRETDLQNVVDMLKSLSDADREGLVELINVAGGEYKGFPDVKPRYDPNSCSVEDIRNLYEWIVDVAMTFINDEEFAASGIAWNMVETLSLILADANELAFRVYELTDEVKRANESIAHLNDVMSDMQRSE